ncbi:DMT family transporter [Ciceribacter naphthalenivorans]|uniref:DMT family transporter n=1 Tax=Ciceribacter naphthalenivorans TaxID=1118451 RepID=UPI0011BE1CB8|nr:DMT family transporter [Ciceribacter naphthalenivorans]
MSASPFEPKRQSVPRGIAFRLISVGSYSLMAALLKQASEHGVVAGEMLFYRAIFALPVVLFWALKSRGISALRTRRPWAHLGRCALGIASILCAFQALIVLPLATATTIGFTAPMFATILSSLILRERAGSHRWLAVMLGLAGIAIIMLPVGPDAHAAPLQGVAIALLGALGTAGVVTTVRQLRHTEHVAAIVFWFFASSAIIGGILLFYVGRQHDAETLAILAGAGVAAGIMQITMTESLHTTQVSVLAPLDYFQIVGALTLGWLIFSEIPKETAIFGGSLIKSRAARSLPCLPLRLCWRRRFPPWPASKARCKVS